MPGCFGVLVRHFFGRFFDNEALSPQADAAANVGPVLGILAVPSAFLALLLQTLTLTGWGLVTFRYFFVGLSMVVMGFITALKWDMLFPDRRDYLILTPLPLRPALVFLAKLAALGMFLGVFLIAVNFFGILMWPGVDRVGTPLRVMAAHSVAVTTGGLFAALTVASLQGLLMQLLPNAWFRRVSTATQAALLAMFVMLFVLTGMIGHMARPLLQGHPEAAQWYPGFWFLGIYEILNPATDDPALVAAGARGWAALATACFAFVVTYLPGYRRSARRSMEPAGTGWGAAGSITVFEHRVLHATLLRNPQQRAVFHFVSQTVGRSMKHRVFLACYVGLGLALTAITGLRGQDSFLALPLTLSFILVTGLRAAFNFPSELRANYVFQLSGLDPSSDYLKAITKWIYVRALVPLVACFGVVEFARNSAGVAAFHVAYGFALAVILTTLVFRTYNKIPFTCAYFPGKMNLIGFGVLYVVGITAYTRVFGSLESILDDSAASMIVGIGLAAAAIAGLHLRRSNPRALDYEGSGDPQIRQLEIVSR